MPWRPTLPPVLRQHSVARCLRRPIPRCQENGQRHRFRLRLARTTLHKGERQSPSGFIPLPRLSPAHGQVRHGNARFHLSETGELLNRAGAGQPHQAGAQSARRCFHSGRPRVSLPEESASSVDSHSHQVLYTMLEAQLVAATAPVSYSGGPPGRTGTRGVNADVAIGSSW